ncbi:MAG TPA: arsenate reductase ArsC [Actinomycetota bacterium]|nr:arsenate reductase ArsC [Actinomycetota bacterium]
MNRVLFVCVHNAGRSVMAEAFVNRMPQESVQAISAGTVPQQKPHPEVVETMMEVGIDVSGHEGRLLTDEMVQAADRVITMGCAVDEQACPAILYADVEDWGLPDPKGESPERVREIREEVARRVESLVNSLAVA